MAPDGRFAYVINKGSGDLSAYRIDATTGMLKPVPGSPFALDYSSFGPNGIVVDPTGRFAYVASDAGVSAFSINAATGVLARIPGSPFATERAAFGTSGFGTASIAISPSGRHAYVLNYDRNTVSAYTIDATGALEPVGSSVDAGQNSNEMGAGANVTVSPQGKFAYATTRCCVYVYAIDATTGGLAPSAHLSFGEPGVFALTGFAIDPTGRFAYILDGSRYYSNDSHVYAYGIDAKTGTLKALPGRGSDAGAEPYSVTIDPSGRFAYVLNREKPDDPAAPATIYSYRINPASGELTALARPPFVVAGNMTDRVARWFNAGRCAAFTSMLWSDEHPPPVAKHDAEGLIFGHVTPATAGYFYDPTSHAALHYPTGDSGGTIILRMIGEPPAGVSRRDLSKLQTASGIKLGSSAEALVGALGEPKIIAGCDQQRYVYLRSRDGEPLSIEFTITHGRVTEISEGLGG
ncbi:MAG: beta-propeller fold lactonase family protein [Candidatus Eremiobacteraeota bacterium]|nr:beta-propeller fold lactonase family protein [Candidatus Eremiobacteraeota bacterium]